MHTRQRHYILDGKATRECLDIMDWASWMETGERRVARTKKDDVEVSTVFLGLNHQFGQGPPLIFETMVFGGEQDGDCYRYSTWEQAKAGHVAMCARCFCFTRGIANAS